MKRSPVKFHLIKICLLAIITLTSFFVAYPQDAQTEKEIDVAIENAMNGNYEQAIPVLNKYADIKGFDDLTTLQINVYLNWCLLSEKNNALDVETVNNLTDAYILKYSISETDSLKSIEEMTLLFMAGIINKYIKNTEKLIYYLDYIHKHYEKRNLPADETYAIILNLLIESYHDVSNFKSAIETAQKANIVNIELFGEKNPKYLNALDKLATLYSDTGDYKKALEINLKVVELGKKIFSENDSDYLTYQNNLASTYSDLGNYQKSLEIILKVVELKKEVFGEKHPDYLLSLNNLSIIYRKLGNYQKSLEIILKVVKLKKEVLGEKHPDYIDALNDLAMTYSSLGDYNKALETSLEVVELETVVLDKKNPNYFAGLNALALIYSELGDFFKALEIKLKVIELEKNVLGEKHPGYLISLIQLAEIYSDLGDYQKALDINHKVLEIEYDVLGETNPYYINSLNNLASLYSAKGDIIRAVDISLNVVNSYKNILGEEHPDYLTSLSNLAYYYSELGDYNKALEINLRIKELRLELLGDKHSDYLISLNNLASNYSDIGDYNKALEIQLKDIKLRKEVLGEKHPKYVLCLGNLANTELKTGQSNFALYHFLKMISIINERVIEYFSLLTEHQREYFWNTFKDDYALFPYYLEMGNSSYTEEAADAYDISLFTKGLILTTAIDFEKLITEKGTFEAIAKFEELKLLKLQIQRLQEKTIAERFLNVDSLENIAQQKETELVKLSKEYGDYTSNLKINWKDVQAKLQDNDVAIEFVEYPTLTDTVKYAALVVRKDWQFPKMIPLFRKDQIDEFIKQDKNKIYSNSYVGKQIKKLIWEPLEEVVAFGERVYFSPAGIIHQLAIENLPLDDSTTLGDHYKMFRLSSTKELVLHQPEPPNATAVLYGGLKYDLDVEELVVQSDKYEFEKNSSYLTMRGYSNDTTVRSGWKFLGGTLEEVEQINRLLTEKNYLAIKYTGETGNEESFKSLSGKRKGIIHIATHGFFLPIEESRKNQFIQMRMGDQQENGGGVDPMLRSGLMLSGGNRAWQGEKIPETVEDGVLTAREISRMDLRGTNLVVLSACETGLGEISSEGVFGLQRSFKQAGVKTLLMSLWEVSDEATRYMMTEFYSGLLSGKEKRAAFFEAKQKCKEKFPEPQYWAAFIMLD